MESTTTGTFPHRSGVIYWYHLTAHVRFISIGRLEIPSCTGKGRLLVPSCLDQLDYWYLPVQASVGLLLSSLAALTNFKQHTLILLHQFTFQIKNLPHLLWNPANANKILFHAERRPLAPGDINLPTIAHAEAQLNHGKPIVYQVKWNESKEEKRERKSGRYEDSGNDAANCDHYHLERYLVMKEGGKRSVMEMLS